ncbi:MAG: nucleoside triphosphate pyrophosphohydrolase [Chloroflexota bacterium]|nr:nucleoside triphosphate pyrophosphohydrolase [Chloroflexota bacterium]
MTNSKIIIVGLGPGNYGDLTATALKVLTENSTIYLRTAKHPTVPYLPAASRYVSFDEVYDRCATFAEVYDTIVSRLLELATQGLGDPVVYAVPGHPLVGEASVLKLLVRAKEAGITTEVVAGLSFIEAVSTALALDPLEQGLTILDATELVQRAEVHLPREKGFGLPVVRPLLISQLYNQRLAGSVKLALMESYPDEHPVTLLRGAGVSGEEGRLELPLYELDRHPEWTDHLTCVYLPPLPILEARGTFEQVQYIMARLRGPSGCPWDREQTHASLKRYLIEETYEVIDALEEEPEKLADELGDLLLQILFHAQLAAEESEFDISDVMESLSTKMIRRHPHIFATTQVSGSAEVLRNWEQIKQVEHAEKGKVRDSVLDGVPREMPALLQSQDLQRKAAGLGFEWRNFDEILDKLVEEVREVKETKNHQELVEEFGDVLAVLANAARWLKVDAEEALRFANNKFRHRFRAWEQIVKERHLDPHQMALPELELLWKEARQRVDEKISSPLSK